MVKIKKLIGIDDKTQEIRLVDVFLLGPFMVYIGSTATSIPLWANWVLIISGLLTSWYNGRNYLRNR